MRVSELFLVSNVGLHHTAGNERPKNDSMMVRTKPRIIEPIILAVTSSF